MDSGLEYGLNSILIFKLLASQDTGEPTAAASRLLGHRRVLAVQWWIELAIAMQVAEQKVCGSSYHSSKAKARGIPGISHQHLAPGGLGGGGGGGEAVQG